MTSTFNSLLPQINKKVRVRGFCPREIGAGTMAKKYPYHQGKVRRHAILAAKKERFEKKPLLWKSTETPEPVKRIKKYISIEIQGQR